MSCKKFVRNDIAKGRILSTAGYDTQAAHDMARTTGHMQPDKRQTKKCMR